MPSNSRIDPEMFTPITEEDDKPILEMAYDLLEQANLSVLEARQVSQETIREVVRRELPSVPRAYRAAINFLTTVENPNTNTPTAHTDLLQPGHPLSTASTDESSLRFETAKYFSSDADIPEDVRPIIASAIEVGPDSIKRSFYEEILYTKNSAIKLLAVVEDADTSIIQKSQYS